MMTDEINPDDIAELYRLALEVGHTFQMIRVGESHPETTKCRLELDKVYTPLGEKIEEHYKQVGSPSIKMPTEQDLAAWNTLAAGQAGFDWLADEVDL